MVCWMKALWLTTQKRVKELEQEIESLRRENEEKDKEIEEKDKEIEERDKEIARLEKEKEKLQRERDHLKEELETARRAAKRQAAPFSKGEPKADPKRPGRKGGANYGPKAHRAIPVEVDEEIQVPLPDECAKCGGEIGNLHVEDQYQTEIVRKTRVIRFRVHVGNCVDCGARVQGRHPRQTSDALGAAASQLGPEAVALATVLNKELGIPFGKSAAVLERGFGLKVTRGGLSQALARMGEKCEPTYEHLKQHLRTSLSVTMDESGWKVAALLWWLWVAVTEEVTVYGILPGRGFKEASSLLGAGFSGFLVRDGWKPYRQFTSAYHQSCQRHLINRCNEMISDALTSQGAAFPMQAKTLLLKGLDLRDRYFDGGVSDHGLAVATGRLEAELWRLLDRPYRLPQNRRLANHLTDEFDYLFTYLKCPGLDATNYRGEQAVRPAVVTRKVWGGNRTENGAHTQEMLMSVLRTSHQNNKDPITLLANLLRAKRPYVLELVSARASPN